MTATHNLPRRRPASPSVDALSESMRTISLQKGSTFQNITPQESVVLEPFLKGVSYPNLPSRSTTCPKALEDLLIGAGERRAAELLQRVDDAIASSSELSAVLNEPEALPVPRFMLGHTETQSQGGSPTTADSRHSDKDSGIGSSIVSSASEKLSKMRNANNNNRPTSAITRSFSGDDISSHRGLSEYAQLQVHKYLITPVLREAALKDFHPLIDDVPIKIESKEIQTLRDLEKTLIYLAPDYSRSPGAYRSFCEASIRCLHLTVNNVHESDRCLPSDRPYSTNYFVDLVEQIRRYANILAATREKQARGEPLDEMDATPSDRIELLGGMTSNGKPALLTRVKDGQHYSLVDGKPIKVEEGVAAIGKRPAGNSVTDSDAAHRSMARRKKNEPIKTYYCSRQGCPKHFKRPCDLTKHLKTHDRPFKCPEQDCKYHELGWPTEKECERHFNDKHIHSPTMYKCSAPGCPYTSKRESNCKQHMEKAHDIPYVRSKSNGKGTATATTEETREASPSTKADSAVTSPLSPPALSPSVVSTMSGPSEFPDQSFAESEFYENFFDFSPEFVGHFNGEYINADPSMPITPAATDDRHTSVSTPITNYSPLDIPINSLEFDNEVFKQDYDFAMFGDNNGNFNMGESASDSNMFLMPTAIPQIPGSYTFPSASQAPMGDDLDVFMQVDTGLGDDFQLYTSTRAAASSSYTRSVSDERQGFDTVAAQFSGNSQGPSDLEILFPGHASAMD